MPKNQYKVLKSERTSHVGSCRDPLHLHRYRRHRRSSLPGGKSPDVQMRVRSCAVDRCRAMPVNLVLLGPVVRARKLEDIALTVDI